MRDALQRGMHGTLSSIQRQVSNRKAQQVFRYAKDHVRSGKIYGAGVCCAVCTVFATGS